jgi:hypothetical protein
MQTDLELRMKRRTLAGVALHDGVYAWVLCPKFGAPALNKSAGCAR